jgi:IS5 family transposase
LSPLSNPLVLLARETLPSRPFRVSQSTSRRDRSGKKRQVTPHFKRKLSERQWKAEGVFGEAKGRHGLRRAKYRGHDKLQIQLYLTALTQNLKRLVSRVSALL